MITVFIGTFNRLDTLERTVDSYQHLSTPYEIVIVDNGSDHPASLALLGELEKRPEVKKVYSLGLVTSMEELTDNYNIAITDQYPRSKSAWFAVTDADISFEGSHPGSLAAYIRVAKKTRFAIGPHTRVDTGISKGYPLRSRILATESRLLYRASMEWQGSVPFSYWPIDTTFHLFPREATHRRLKMNTARCGPPFDAMHLDWYIDFFNPTDENWIYVLDDRGAVGSWGRKWLRDIWILWFEHGPEAMYEALRAVPRDSYDLCNTSFLLSWCSQYGYGTSQDKFKSIMELYNAVPDHSVWFELLKNSVEMIYEDDFSCLGW